MSKVLVVGRDPAIMSRVLPLLRGEGFEAAGALDGASALEAMQAPVDVLVVGGGVEPGLRGEVLAAFAARHPGRPVVQHRGGPVGLVEAIHDALAASSGGAGAPRP